MSIKNANKVNKNPGEPNVYVYLWNPKEKTNCKGKKEENEKRRIYIYIYMNRVYSEWVWDCILLTEKLGLYTTESKSLAEKKWAGREIASASQCK